MIVLVGRGAGVWVRVIEGITTVVSVAMPSVGVAEGGLVIVSVGETGFDLQPTNISESTHSILNKPGLKNFTMPPLILFPTQGAS